jgi:hypothetical protein
MSQIGQSGSNARGQITFLPDGSPYVTNMNDLGGFAVAQLANWEFVEQSLYDSFAYAAAGVLSQAMFQVPVGQGAGFGGGTKTPSDTNMQLAGQLSTGSAQLVTSIELQFQPATPTVTAGMPAVFGAQLAATSINDAYIFWRSGNLNLFVLAKTYLQEAPMSRFPGSSDFSLQAAVCDATTLAAASQSRIGFASSYGQIYMLSPENILIPPTTSFKLTLAWPEGVQAITNPARIFAHLNGMQARLAQ